MFTPLSHPDLARLHQLDLLHEAERRRFARAARLSDQAIHHPARVQAWWKRSMVIAAHVLPRSSAPRPAL